MMLLSSGTKYISRNARGGRWGWGLGFGTGCGKVVGGGGGMARAPPAGWSGSVASLLVGSIGGRAFA